MSAREWGPAIEAGRLYQEMTQETLAALVGVSQQTVSKWERSQVIPRDDMKELIAKALGVEVHDLFSFKVGV